MTFEWSDRTMKAYTQHPQAIKQMFNLAKCRVISLRIIVANTLDIVASLSTTSIRQLEHKYNVSRSSAMRWRHVKRLCASDLSCN